MSYQPELSALSAWLESAAKRWAGFRAKLPRLSNRWLLLISLISLVAVASLLRCLHLLEPGHFYILSPDSYFFHWLADRIMTGQGPPPDALPGAIWTLHSGWAWPMAYIAKAVGYVFNMSSVDALAIVGKFLAPLIGIISMFVIYLAAAKLYDRKVGLLSAFVWAILFHAVMIGAVGYLDRDSLSILLIMTGALLFFVSRSWKLSIGGRDVGWLAAGALVLGIELLLYLEWSLMGSLLLLIIISSYVLVKFLLEYFAREGEQNVVRRVTNAISVVNWRTFATIGVANILVAAINYPQVPSWFDRAVLLIKNFGRGGTESAYLIAEMQGLGFTDLLAYQFLLIPLVIGLYIAWKKRADSTIFFSSWFIVCVILALFTKRLLLYTLPAAALLSGVGLAFLLDWARQGLFHMWKKIGMVVLVGLAFLIAFSSSYALGGVYANSPDERWQDALAFIREETPQDSMIMTQWSWGYWILDVGQRRPLVDNGYYGWELERLHDVGIAYTTNDPAEAVRVMEKYGADYLVFSTLDLRIQQTILVWADLLGEYESFPYDSLFVRTMNGEFKSGGGLEIVYSSTSDPESGPEPEVVILGLIQPASP